MSWRNLINWQLSWIFQSLAGTLFYWSKIFGCFNFALGLEWVQQYINILLKWVGMGQHDQRFKTAPRKVWRAGKGRKNALCNSYNRFFEQYTANLSYFYHLFCSHKNKTNKNKIHCNHNVQDYLKLMKNLQYNILLLCKFCRRVTHGCILEVKCYLSLQNKNTWYEWRMVCCLIITIHRHTSVNLISDCTCSLFCSRCLIIDQLNKQKMSVAGRKKHFTSGKNNLH